MRKSSPVKETEKSKRGKWKYDLGRLVLYLQKRGQEGKQEEAKIHGKKKQKNSQEARGR
jgi:hypothetical protein